MEGVRNFFSKKYKDLVDKLTKERYQCFYKCADDENRIKILYPYLREMTITPEVYNKDYHAAMKQKEYGNSYFAKRENKNALNCYSKGIIKCPQDNADHKKLLAILIANRSACLFDLNEYEKALQDINYVIHVGTYQDDLKYKLFIRQAKCQSHLPNKLHLVSESYRRALEYLDLSTMDKSAIEAKKLEIKDALQKVNYVHPELSIDALDLNFESNLLFPSASTAVFFDFESSLGRFARANSNIDVGTVIVQERAHCAVVAPEFTLTNCQHCMIATDIPVACDKCGNVVFCSVKCKSEASSYHTIECGLHPTIFESGASINCLLALRIITQRDVDYFLSISNELENGKRSFPTPEIHTFENYACVYNLCSHKNSRKMEELFHYTMMSIYLLYLLKKSIYFNSDVRDDVLTESELFICTLILHNLQLLQFNAHEVSELQRAPPGPLDPKDETNFKAIYIGGGLYPTLALFNHSCDPSIVRYNVGSKMIVKTIKPIQESEIIYENYGPIYTNTVKSERKKFLKERYWFDCVCQACEEDWCLFKDMEEAVVRIPCKNIECKNFFFLHSNIISPTMTCSTCNTVTNLFSILKVLSGLEDILNKAEQFYKQHNYKEATKCYQQGMKIYFNNTIPPFPDWIKVQQRLRTCMISFGNKCIDYNMVIYKYE